MYAPFIQFRNSNPAFLSFSPTLPVIGHCCSTDLRFYDIMVSIPHIESIIMEAGYHIVDCSYPDSFVLTKCSDFFIRLSLLSCEELSTCIRNFRGSIPRGSRKKANYITLIENDFVQQANALIWTATPDLPQMTTPPPGPQPPPRLWLVCQLMHRRYGALVASRLLCSRARWNPPAVAEDKFIQPACFSTPISKLQSRLAKLDVQLVKACCDLYLAPDSTPRLKTQRYSFLIERFSLPADP